MHIYSQRHAERLRIRHNKVIFTKWVKRLLVAEAVLAVLTLISTLSLVSQLKAVDTSYTAPTHEIGRALPYQEVGQLTEPGDIQLAGGVKTYQSTVNAYYLQGDVK